VTRNSGGRRKGLNTRHPSLSSADPGALAQPEKAQDETDDDDQADDVNDGIHGISFLRGLERRTACLLRFTTRYFQCTVPFPSRTVGAPARFCLSKTVDRGSWVVDRPGFRDSSLITHHWFLGTALAEFALRAVPHGPVAVLAVASHCAQAARPHIWHIALVRAGRHGASASCSENPVSGICPPFNVRPKVLAGWHAEPSNRAARLRRIACSERG